MSDEGFHEIQLNGKQLVFLFMAGTVAAVVIFLLGVMVGRNVQRPAGTEPSELVSDAGADPTAAALPAPPPASTIAPGGTPATAQETLTYPDRLEDATPPNEQLRESSDPTSLTPRSGTSTPPASVAETRPEPAPAETTSMPEPPGNGWVLQVAATKTRAEADTIAKRLAAKGYPTFVTAPAKGGPNMFRVRVGKYADRKEAESVSLKLQKQEQFKPWLTK